ncbi:hypothetical protein [Nocardia cyriacigeorgica]|uniref:hypothetical protein n=1 Tax=Nocardia cyriacigeorgica TaxID=135487 RepID=UPI0024565998|nr:hypothetical protein [Nocardia cyriacigeorgica]
MTDFDKLYHFVQEMNRDWAMLVGDIRSGRRLAQLSEERHRVPVVDDFSGAEYGTIVVDGRGTIRSIMLEPYEVSQSNEQHILAAIIGALNSRAARPTRTSALPKQVNFHD